MSVSAVFTAIALLSGCNGSAGSQSSGLTPSSGVNPAALSHGANALANDVGEPSDTFAGLKWMGDVHPDRNKSWVSPDVKKGARVLFASDVGTNDVYMFTLPDLTLKGTLTGFNEPQGECSDVHGNVYIANTKSSEVLEYSHAGTLTNTYKDTYGYPIGCAINPVTGNLAVMNIHSRKGAGQILIYSGSSSSPKVLTNPKQYYYYFGGFNPQGTRLWVDGKDRKGAYMVSECTPPSSPCTTVPIRGAKMHAPGAVQFDQFEGAWVLFDQGPCAFGGSCSYWVYANQKFKLSAPNNYETYKGGPSCDLIQGMIRDTGNEFVVGGDDESACLNASTSEDRWPYTPQLNAAPTNYTTEHVSHPVGAAISQ